MPDSPEIIRARTRDGQKMVQQLTAGHPVKLPSRIRFSFANDAEGGRVHGDVPKRPPALDKI